MELRGKSKRRSAHASSKLCCTTTVILGIFILLFVYYKASLHNFSWYNRSTVNLCQTPKQQMDDLLSLAKDTSVALNNMDIHHFLAYGSLWGGLRHNGPLPWDNDFDFGVMYTEIIKFSEQEMIDKFKAYGIDCYYSYRFGFYRVTRATARGDIMIYRDFYNTGWLHRTGWEAYLFFINYRHFHTFPGRLVKLPMPTVRFGSTNISVPHKGIELQKYHYPDDWWIVGKPRGCT